MADNHHNYGILNKFFPAIVKLDELNKIVQATDGDTILMAQVTKQYKT